jgi:hypothetical protein
VTNDYNAWAPKRNRVDLSGVDTKRAVVVRVVKDKERAPKEKPRFSIKRKASGAGRGRDLGADIVRDRRGRHLRL